MTIRIDRIVVAVADVPQAAQQYQRLLGVPPLACPPSAAWWDLGNTVIELAQRDVEHPRVQGIVFSSPEGTAHDTPVHNALGIDLRLCDGARTTAARGADPDAPACGLRVDHLVLRTGDAEACIALFAGQLGVRLALDRSAPQWGGRMLFFRAGQLTLEVIAADEEPPSGAYFWGLAYACEDLAQRVQLLQAGGVSVSAVREGRKPGTSVATVKSHCLDIPTLLIQPATG